MNKQTRFIPALALAMAMLSIPTLATAVVTINVVDPAPLVGKGVGALVSVEVTCDVGSDSSGSLSLTLSQRSGSVVAQGFGNINTIVCDPTTTLPTTQTFQILVTSFGKIFHKGSSITQASVFICGSLGCDFPQVTEDIQLVK